MEAKVRIQLNLKVDHAPYIYSTHTFPQIVFPIIWLEEVSTLAVVVLPMACRAREGTRKGLYLTSKKEYQGQPPSWTRPIC